MSQARDEENWWSEAGDDNLHGVPPYDIDEVSRIILTRCDAHPARVLDLGCGRGRLTNSLAQYLPEWSFHGVDISRDLLDLAVVDAKGLSNVHYWHGNGRTLPSGLGARQYDLAYSITVLQHIPHDAKWSYIREVEKRLKPGGTFTFTIAVGPIEQFLNHQIADVLDFNDDLISLFHATAISEPDERGWTWVTCWKAS